MNTWNALLMGIRQERHLTYRRIVVHLAAVLLIESNPALCIRALVGPASIGRVCFVMGIGHLGQHLHIQGIKAVMVRDLENACLCA